MGNPKGAGATGKPLHFVPHKANYGESEGVKGGDRKAPLLVPQSEIPCLFQNSALIR